jgi:hypothetical protein
MLQFANEARQTVDKILNPTIFTRNSLCDRLHHRPSMGLVMAARSSLDKSSFGSLPSEARGPAVYSSGFDLKGCFIRLTFGAHANNSTPADVNFR